MSDATDILYGQEYVNGQPVYNGVDANGNPIPVLVPVQVDPNGVVQVVSNS